MAISGKRKEAWIAALKAAYDDVIESQDEWRERIKALVCDQPKDPWDALDEIGGFQGLETRMAEAGAPVVLDDEDWERLCGVSWDQRPDNQLADRIKDPDISSHVHHLHRVTDHRDRIKAIALCASILGVPADGQDIWLIYRAWQLVSILQLIEQGVLPRRDPGEAAAETEALLATLATKVPSAGDSAGEASTS